MTVDMVKKNYDRGLWNKKMVKTAVKKGAITAQQYETITGEVYTV